MKQRLRLVRFLLFILLVMNTFPVLSQGVKGSDTRKHTFQITKDKVQRTNKEREGKKDEVRRMHEKGRVSGDESKLLKDVSSGEKRQILMVGQVPLTVADTELLAAMKFVKKSDGYSLKYRTFQELKKHPKLLQEASVIWFHRSDSSQFSSDESDPKVIKQLREYIDNGGRLLLTLDAFPYLNLLGIETTIPSVRYKSSVDEGYGRKLGFHAYREHPLFNGLNGGAYIYKPTRDLTVRVHGFFGDTIPSKGKVVAIDWDYIFFREHSKVIVEYEAGNGKVLAVGAYTLFAPQNDNRIHLEFFAKNMLNYLTGVFDHAPRLYWDYAPPAITQCPEKIQNRDVLFEAIPEAIPWDIKPHVLTFPIHAASKEYCEAAGERILIMAQENGGIEEIWTHPFMAIRDFETGIRATQGVASPAPPHTDSDSIIWLNDLKPEIEIRPNSFIRHYNLDHGILDEVVTADPTHPYGVVHYTWNGTETFDLSIRFRTNLRLMWPYPAGSIGSICYGWDADYNAFVFGDKSGDMAVMVGGNKVPLYHYAEQGRG